MEYRVGRPPDGAAIIAHTQALARESEGREPDAAAVARGVTAALADPHKARYTVAVEDGVVVGCLFVTYEWSDWTGGWYWWIQGVYVVPTHRGRGIYRAMVEEVRAEARRRGDVGRRRLYVHAGNNAGMEAHAALGFSKTAYRIYDASV
jgi:GNAT superfamily N-acetyltransferase